MERFCPQTKSTPSVLSPRSQTLDHWKPCWRNWHEGQQGVFFAALPKYLEFGKFFLHCIQVADKFRRWKEGKMEEGEFIFSCSGKKQEKERDSFVFLQTKERKSWGKASSWKESYLFWTSVLWWGSCVSAVSGHFWQFSGSELSVVQNALQGYIFFPCMFAAYYEI